MQAFVLTVFFTFITPAGNTIEDSVIGTFHQAKNCQARFDRFVDERTQVQGYKLESHRIGKLCELVELDEGAEFDDEPSAKSKPKGAGKNQNTIKPIKPKLTI